MVDMAVAFEITEGLGRWPAAAGSQVTVEHSQCEANGPSGLGPMPLAP
jgi:hypothetical protein